MVLEAIISSKKIEHHPAYMFIYAVIVASASLWAAHIIFPSAQSIVFLFLITISLTPVIYKVLQDKEKEDEDLGKHINLNFFESHGRILEIYLFFFLGILFAVSIWYSFLPTPITDNMFSYEINTLRDLRGSYNCQIGDSSCSLIAIIMNNIKVLTLCFLVAFFFGTGAIFILSWNAAVIGVFIGELTKTSISHHGSTLLSFAVNFPNGLGSIILHGLPEIAAYCIAGIAGGILSVAIIQGKRPERIIKDSTALIIMAVIIIILAGILEVYVTPIL